MEIVSIIGFIAVILHVVRIFPQVIKGFMTKKVHDVSLWWELIALASAITWLIYAILIDDLSLLVANIITVIAFLLLLYQKWAYDKL